MPNEILFIQRTTLVVILVLLIIRLIPEIIKGYRKMKVNNETEPYARFKLTCQKTNSRFGNKIDQTIMFEKSCNQIGLILFVKSLDDALKESSNGETDLIEFIKDVRKAEKEGALNAKGADEDS